MIYFIIFIILFAFTYIFDFTHVKKGKYEAYWGMCLIFICISGFRYHIGIDSIYYEMSWPTYPDLLNFNWVHDINQFRSDPDRERYQLGWILYVMILQAFSKNFLILQFSNALLINFAIFRTIKKYTNYIFSSILVYFCTFTFVEFEFELMREVVAVSIFLIWGIDNYFKKKWWRYYLAVFMAFQFHPSSITMFLLPIVRNLNLSTFKYLCFFVLPGLLIGLGGRLLLGNVLNIVFGEYSYMSEYMENSPEGNFNYFLMYSFRPLGLLTLFIFGKKHIHNIDYIPLFYFSIFFLLVGALVYTAARFINYIIIIDYIVIARILYVYARKFKTIYIFPLYLMMIYLPNIYQYKEPTALARHYPYRSIFNPKPTKNQQTVERLATQGLR